MRFCCREITIDGTDLRVYPSGSIWRFNQRQKKWTHAKCSFDGIGYLVININKKMYRTYRIVVHAYFCFDLLSSLSIDHRDRNKLNNGVWNLRIVSHQENMWNRIDKGISKNRDGWLSSICIKGVRNTKYFKTEEEALEWRKEMKTLHHKITEPNYKHIMTQCLRNI
jgi:hypothetical protein